MATDNGIVTGVLPELDRLLLGPGERAEILVSFAANDDVVLRSYEQQLGSENNSLKQIGGADTFDLVRFTGSPDLSGSPEPPAAVLPARTISVPDDARVRTFSFDGHNRINDSEMDMNRIDEIVPAGALEIWEIESNGNPHTFHIHGATFHVLDVNGNEPDLNLLGPKDTVAVASGHAVRLAVQFVSHIDPDMPFMYHCHLLKHEDNGMMGQFVIVEPGMEAATPRTLDSGHASH